MNKNPFKISGEKKPNKSIQEFFQIGFKLQLGAISILGLQAVPRFVPGSV